MSTVNSKTVIALQYAVGIRTELKYNAAIGKREYSQVRARLLSCEALQKIVKTNTVVERTVAEIKVVKSAKQLVSYLDTLVDALRHLVNIEESNKEQALKRSSAKMSMVQERQAIVDSVCPEAVNGVTPKARMERSLVNNPYAHSLANVTDELRYWYTYLPTCQLMCIEPEYAPFKVVLYMSTNNNVMANVQTTDGKEREIELGYWQYTNYGLEFTVNKSLDKRQSHRVFDTPLAMFKSCVTNFWWPDVMYYLANGKHYE